eukprot:2682152-Rhodomonas_salina.2
MGSTDLVVREQAAWTVARLKSRYACRPSVLFVRYSCATRMVLTCTACDMPSILGYAHGRIVICVWYCGIIGSRYRATRAVRMQYAQSGTDIG